MPGMHSNLKIEQFSQEVWYFEERNLQSRSHLKTTENTFFYSNFHSKFNPIPNPIHSGNFFGLAQNDHEIILT